MPAKSVDKATLLASLEAFLCQLAIDGKRALLVVDEAQNLTPRAVEELRMLSNFQLGDQALLQSFLIGQPELRDMMHSQQMQQLRQRVIASYHLGPMDKTETQAYVEHRLVHVGWKGDPKFEPAAFDVIHAEWRHTGRINTLCSRLLLGDSCRRTRSIPTTMQAIAREIREELGPETALAAVAVARAREHAGTGAGAQDSGAWLADLHEIDDESRARKTVGSGRRPAASIAAPGSNHEAGHAGEPLMAICCARPGPLVCVVGASQLHEDGTAAARIRSAHARRCSCTGQHYDLAMNERLFADLQLPPA